jgi:CRISPR-associated protein Csc1
MLPFSTPGSMQTTATTLRWRKTQKNIPSFGRAKEIAPESRFEFFAISQKPLKLPKWIRLGKWMSKAEVTIAETQDVKPSTTEQPFIFPYPLNP